jgi:hypothetical protein
MALKIFIIAWSASPIGDHDVIISMAQRRYQIQKKGGVSNDSPFVHDSRMLNLELVSPVQIAVRPASTASGPAIVFNPEVSLYGRGQV